MPPSLSPPLIVIGLLLAPASLAAGRASTAPAPLPGSLTKDRPAWRALLRWPASCDQGGKVSPWMGWEGNGGISVLGPFPSGVRLVQVACHGGAYRAYYLLYLVDPHRKVTGPLVLPLYMERSSLLGLPGRRHGRRLDKPTLVRQAKVRGNVEVKPLLEMLEIVSSAGNCGFYSTFRLSGKRFVPVEARGKLECDDQPPIDPREWSKLPLP